MEGGEKGERMGGGGGVEVRDMEGGKKGGKQTYHYGYDEEISYNAQ